MMEHPMVVALKDIVFYNGHSEWLNELVKGIEDSKKRGVNYANPFPISRWHTEEHTIWMLLVGMFGDWGTSIRSGWISHHDECIAFLKNLIHEWEEEE